MKTEKVKNRTIKLAGASNKSGSSKSSIITPKEAKPRDITQLKTKIPKSRKPLKTIRAEKRGRPKTHGLSGTPTYQSYKAARNRCTNPKFLQYKDYGGRGIEFLFRDVTELVEEIGLRPEGKSLDRIDPNGNYEPGNVRWASAQQQAKNRRPARQSKKQEFYEKRGREQLLERRHNALQEWTDRAYFWRLSIKAVSGVTLSEVRKNQLAKLEKSLRIQNIHEQIQSCSGKNNVNQSHTIYLPSLVQSQSYIPLRSIPVFGSPSDEWLKRGLVRELSQRPLQDNMLRKEAKLYNNWFFDKHSNGLALYENPSFYGSFVEGKLLTFASRAFFKSYNIRFATAVELERELYINDPENVFREKFLVIPDLQAGHQRYYGFGKHLTDALLQFLICRHERNCKTIVYTKNLHLLPSKIEGFLRNFYQLEWAQQFTGFDLDYPPPP